MSPNVTDVALKLGRVTVTGVFAAIVEHDRRKPDISNRVIDLRGYREWHSRRRELTRHVERKMTPSKGGSTA